MLKEKTVLSLDDALLCAAKDHWHDIKINAPTRSGRPDFSVGEYDLLVCPLDSTLAIGERNSGGVGFRMFLPKGRVSYIPADRNFSIYLFGKPSTIDFSIMKFIHF